MDWNKKSNIAIFFGCVAAIVSAIVLIVIFWDKLLALCPCKCRKEAVEEAPTEPDFCEEELQDFADINRDN